ncbi:VanZ family protein [Jiangella alkaliphila]|uniref:VanZ like family protein n=1 Tax=Jiangella alkaliphila TaxID=419479 RepID=A0A1H2KZ53_9ACTN|nr:VanZ family protein [Jiangella alkaliphila]SDU73611.1 VanZ like family protein [Jiangella alkaliphila]
MIYDFLLFNKPLAYATLLVVVVAGIVAGYLLTRRGEAGRRPLWVLAGLAVLPVLGLTLVPELKSTAGWPDEVRCAFAASVPPLNVLVVANAVLFLVPVFLAALAARRPAVVFAAGAALSALVEGLQALIPSLGRACDVDDWVVNTLGAAAGALLALGVMTAARRRESPRPLPPRGRGGFGG